MTKVFSSGNRLLAGMQPSGPMHLGHYHGVLRHWIKLQHEYDCFFFFADWHALSRHYEAPEILKQSLWDMAIDCLAAGIDHGACRLFIQSWVPEHAELYLLLSMLTPLNWLERIPSTRESLDKLSEGDGTSYGALGCPLLQSADILAYRASHVPIDEDQITHIELTREIARRFNFIYGREVGFEGLAEGAIDKMGKKNARLYRKLRKRFQEVGDHEALDMAHALLESQQNIAKGDRERLYGYLDIGGKIILPEPETMLLHSPTIFGLDGQRMSNRENNIIALRDPPAVVEKKIMTMPTDPARVKRNDPGEPEKCPVWKLHQLYSDDGLKQWVTKGCRSADIGCVDCKKTIVDAVNEELKPVQVAAKEYQDDPSLVKSIIAEGSEAAREEVRETLNDVREAMGLEY